MKVIKSLAKRVLRRCVVFASKYKKKRSGIEYWEQRAKKFGLRSVLGMGHSEEEIEAVTRRQKDEIFPVLKQQLKGNEKLILDFGCGTGRFTSDLATLIQGRAIGVDPIKHLIDLAPKNENVDYILIQAGTIPVKTASIDIIWICLVLGGITDETALYNTINEIDRVLKEGLVFLVENTTEKKDGYYWKFRSVRAYQTLFKFVELKHISDYFDLGERISIMTGRRCVFNTLEK